MCVSISGLSFPFSSLVKKTLGYINTIVLNYLVAESFLTS